MLLLSAHHFAGAIVVHVCGGKQRLGVSRSEGRKAFQVVVKLLGDILEVDNGIDMQHRLRLLRLDMVIHILLETLSKLLDFIPFQCQTGSIGVSAEVHEQVPAFFNGRIHIEARHATC